MPHQNPNGNPLVVTFVDRNYIPVLVNWLAFTRRVGRFDIRVYCLDSETFEFSHRSGLSAELVGWDGSFTNLWVQRLRILADLVANGRPIIHTDSDCIWLSDPLSNGFDGNADFVFSQGTIHPIPVHNALGFVLCCGLFRVNPGPNISEFLYKLAGHVETTGDDQASVNELLFDAGTVWDKVNSPDYKLRFKGRTFSCWTETLRGVCEQEKLTIDLVPHNLVQRVPDPTSTESKIVAKHHLSAKDAKAKLEWFRKQGLLALRPDWHTLGPNASYATYMDFNSTASSVKT